MTTTAAGLVDRVLKSLVGHRDLAGLGGLATVLFITFTVTTDNFLTVINFQSMGFQVAEIALFSLAIMISMLAGGIDLSVVSTASLAAIVLAKLFGVFINDGSNLNVGLVALCCGAAILVGAGCGLLNGLLVAKLGIAPILATLATMQVINGIGIVWTGGNAVYGMPDSFLNLGSGDVFGIPTPVIIMFVAAALVAVFVGLTGVGFRLRMVGANATAALYSGLNPARTLISTYIASGIVASIAGIITASRAASASADYGTSYLLLAIVIVVLGGVSPFGGSGTVAGVLLAAGILQMVATGFNMLKFSPFAYQVAQGVILITVIALNVVSQRRGQGWFKRLIQSRPRTGRSGA